MPPFQRLQADLQCKLKDSTDNILRDFMEGSLLRGQAFEALVALGYAPDRVEKGLKKAGELKR